MMRPLYHALPSLSKKQKIISETGSWRPFEEDMERPSIPASPYPLVLASASPRRRELFALLGLPFRVAVAQVAEVVERG